MVGFTTPTARERFRGYSPILGGITSDTRCDIRVCTPYGWVSETNHDLPASTRPNDPDAERVDDVAFGSSPPFWKFGGLQ
jgi:hypothetical protein